MPKSKKRLKKASSRKNTPPAINAMSVRRTREAFPINLNEIHVPEWMAETDEIFCKLYEKYLTGRISGFLTRIPMKMIKEGSYVPSRTFEYVCDTPPDDIVREQMLSIQQGARPPLHLYANPKSATETRFLCPDDVAIYLAYKKLGVSTVPAIVFSPGSKPLPFSSFESKAYPSKAKLGIRISGMISTEKPSSLPSLIGLDLPNDPREIIRILSTHLRRLIASLRLFHVQEDLHYHQMVFSALIRAQETLDAIDVLIEKNLWYQALSLLRVLYEIHLNFYFDWLQPETNYRYLAAAAVFSTADLARNRKSMSQELIAEGLTIEAATECASIAWRPVSFASNVSEKARLPKVGIAYHKDIYEFLSQISHQNFEIASLHANRFDDEAFKAIDDDVKTTYLRFMDFIVSEFAQCVEQDLGVSP